MKAIKGTLDPFFETGTEGVVWSLFEPGQEGYNGLHPLNNGDHLTIYHPENGSVVWEGNILLEWERNFRPYPLNPQYGQQEVLGFWVHGFQYNVEPETWGKWFFAQYPAELIESEVGNTYPVAKSSTIASWSWKGRGSPYNDIRDSADLTLVFKTGDAYRYKDVDYYTKENFYESESKGKYFAAHIKNKFVTEKISLPKRS